MGFLGNALQGNYHLGTYTYLSAAVGLADYRFSVNAIPLAESGQDIGVMFRYQDNNHYYRLSFSSSDGFTRLEKKLGGSFSTLAKNARGYEKGGMLGIQVEIANGLIPIGNAHHVPPMTDAVPRDQILVRRGEHVDHEVSLLDLGRSQAGVVDVEGNG